MNKAMKLILTLTAMLAAGCGEANLAPSSQEMVQQDQTAPGGGSTANLAGFDTVRFSFQFDPSRANSFSLGQGNNISFPAHSLCATTSSYGPTEWDKPCTAATSPVTFTVKAWLDKTNHPRIDFKPSVRFVPSTNPANWVMLSFTDKYAAANPLFNILYCANGAAKCVNEVLTDPTLATLRDPVTGRVYRRVKHFSGYTITTDGCDPSVDPDCPSGDGGGFNRVGLKLSGSEH